MSDRLLSLHINWSRDLNFFQIRPKSSKMRSQNTLETFELFDKPLKGEVREQVILGERQPPVPGGIGNGIKPTLDLEMGPPTFIMQITSHQIYRL